MEHQPNDSFQDAMLRRSSLLLGPKVMGRLQSARVILFGVGGVGSWCAESLIRTGLRHLTIVDSDRVCITNCNRQLLATSQTIGQVKVEVMKQRLLSINPEAEITAIEAFYSPENAAQFHLEDYDYVIDAIDSLVCKAHLILSATSLPDVRLFCSMGAALRMDPLKVTVAEFWKVEGDALARALRTRFKKHDSFPRRKFKCVYSTEPVLPHLGDESALAECEPDGSVKRVNGSLSLVTGTFGLTLASLVLKDIYESQK